MVWSLGQIIEAEEIGQGEKNLLGGHICYPGKEVYSHVLVFVGDWLQNTLPYPNLWVLKFLMLNGAGH